LKILVGVKSCQKDRNDGCHDAIRETWGRNMPPGTKTLFFMGGGLPSDLKGDEILLWTRESYWDNLEKTRAFFKWSLPEDYDYLFLTDTDVYIVPHLWASCGFEKYDYSGDFAPEFELGKAYPPRKSIDTTFDPFYNFCGGCGPFLSRKVVEYLVSLPSTTNAGDDFWIGQELGPLISRGEITAAHLPNFKGQAVFHFNCTLNSAKKDARGKAVGHLPRLNPVELIREKHKELLCP
jgi:hypothetical protein